MKVYTSHRRPGLASFCIESVVHRIVFYLSSKTLGRSLQNTCFKVKKTMFTSNDMKDTDKNTTIFCFRVFRFWEKTSTKMNFGSY